MLEMKGFEQIIIHPSTIYNPTSYPFIGRGVHGAVFRLTEEACVKIYAEEQYKVMEEESYEKLKGFSCAPAVYELGSNYMVLEYMEGVILNHYLKDHDIDEVMSVALLLILEELKDYGSEFADIELNNVIVKEDGSLKIFDFVNVYNNQRRIPFFMLNSLAKNKRLTTFMKHVKKYDPVRYKSWRKFVELFPV
jgi:RIO-like serine/threonine protein kinase